MQALQLQASCRNLAVSLDVRTDSKFGGEDRQADKFRLGGYPTAKGCAAAYFPGATH